MEGRKERIVGFLTLGALAVIFLPMLFDGQGMRESELQVNIPDAPRFPVMEASQPQQPVLEDSTEPAPPMPEPDGTRRPRMNAPSAVAAPTVSEPAASKPASTQDSPITPSAPDALTLEREVPVLDQQGVPVAWTLQLAAFKERSNAEGLRDRLLKAGYKAYIREKNSLSRVFIGPEVQRTVLEKLKAKLRRELKLDGLILRFTTS